MKYQAENLQGFQGPVLSNSLPYIKGFQEQAKKLNLLYSGTVTETPKYTGCNDPFSCPYVLLNGEVYACSYMANLRRSEVYRAEVFSTPYKDYRMGSLHDTFMRAIWRNENYINLRNALKQAKPIRKYKTLSPQQLQLAKQKYAADPNPKRFSYCQVCSCLWGQSGI